MQHSVERHDVHANLSACAPDVALDIALESEQDAKLLEHDDQHGGGRHFRIPPSVWEVCKKFQTCYRCEEPGHRAKECNVKFWPTGWLLRLCP